MKPAKVILRRLSGRPEIADVALALPGNMPSVRPLHSANHRARPPDQRENQRGAISATRSFVVLTPAMKPAALNSFMTKKVPTPRVGAIAT